MKRVFVLLLVVVFFAPVGPAASRTWKSISGRFSTEADLLGLKDGKVQLKKTDGTVIDVPLERLSDADQQYVKERYSEAATAGDKSDNKEAVASADKSAAAATDGDNAVQDVAMKLLRLDRPKRTSHSKSGTLSDYILA